MPLAGNFSQNPMFDSVDHLPPGFRMFMLTGTARITTTTTISLQILDRFDQPLLVPASAGDPSWICAGDFTIGRPLTGSANADVIKLGQSAADATFTALVNSTAVAANVMAAQTVRTSLAPSAVVGPITVPSTLGLFLHNGSNAAPGGVLSLPVVAGQPSFLRIPVRVLYLRRLPGVTLNEIQLSAAAQRLDAGII